MLKKRIAKRFSSRMKNKETTLTHDFNRGIFGKKGTLFLTVSTVSTIFIQSLKGVATHSN